VCEASEKLQAALGITWTRKRQCCYYYCLVCRFSATI